MENMAITSGPIEPNWCLARRESGHLFWRSDSTKVKFRCDVEVVEFLKDPAEDHYTFPEDKHYSDDRSANTFMVSATCLAVACVTILLPWFLIGSS